MNKEQLQEEYTKTKDEYEIIKKDYDRLTRKLDLLINVLGSIDNYEEGINNNFSDISPLTRFLKSDNVILDPKLYCRQKVFIRDFEDYCKKNHLLSSKWTNQFYAGPFAELGIKVVNNARKRYPNAPNNKTYTETFIIGVDVKDLFESGSEIENDDD